MALGENYATLAELKARLGGVTGSGEDDALNNALSTASRAVEQFCRRQFNQAATASARVYDHCTRTQGPAVVSEVLALVDDFYSTTGLVVATDEDDDGVFETTWTSSDYQLEPLNGIVSGESGWPYWKIRAVGDYRFPVTNDRASLQLTAPWGWSAVLAVVKEASLITAEEVYVLKDAPFGVKGFADLGIVRIRDNMRVMSLLAPYRRDAVLVGGD